MLGPCYDYFMTYNSSGRHNGLGKSTVIKPLSMGEIDPPMGEIGP